MRIQIVMVVRSERCELNSTKFSLILKLKPIVRRAQLISIVKLKVVASMKACMQNHQCNNRREFKNLISSPTSLLQQSLNCINMMKGRILVVL